MGLKDQIRNKSVQLPVSELRGFEAEPLSREDKIKSEEKRAQNRANAAKQRLERKEADKAQKAFQELKETLKKEGKL